MERVERMKSVERMNRVERVEERENWVLGQVPGRKMLERQLCGGGVVSDRFPTGDLALGNCACNRQRRVGMVRVYKDYFALGHVWMIETLYSRRK